MVAQLGRGAAADRGQPLPSHTLLPAVPHHTSPPLSKGNQVNIPEPGLVKDMGVATQVNAETAGKRPGKSSLFFLTVCNTTPAHRRWTVDDPGITLRGERVRGLAEHRSLRGVRCALDGP